MSRIGETVAGKYRLNRLIGEGAIGAVYAAVHQFTGRHVALKLIDASIAEHEGFAARFLTEARAAADIGHPVICDVLDAGQEPDGSLYLALELLEGRTFEDAIEANDISLEEMVEVTVQLLDGIAAAHDRGIVHRDIKPENIFLTWNAEGDMEAKLLDFGVAKRTKGAPDLFRTAQGAILGTPYYMAPEQAAGDEVDSRADIWSAGAVLFHAITGRPPFDEDTYNRLIGKLLNEDPPRLASLKPGVPEWLATAVDGALQRDVDIRWQSARTMAEALRLRGSGAIELDWELHEDQTVRTDSFYESGEDDAPALAALAGPEVPNIEVDLDLSGAPTESGETSTLQDHPAFDIGGATIRSDLPPAPLRHTPTPAYPSGYPHHESMPPPESSGSNLLLGVALGVVATLLLAGVGGWLIFVLFLS